MVQFQHKTNTHKHISYCHNFFKNSFSQKNTKRKRLRGKCKYWQKSVKTEQVVKMIFFQKCYVAQMRKPRTRKHCVYSTVLRTKKLRSIWFFCEFIRLKQWTTEICFLRKNPKYRLNFSPETLLGSTKTQKKRYSGVAKEKTTPRCKEKENKRKRGENGEIKRVVSRKRFSLTPFS